MSVLSANCPACAAPIEFQKGSTIVVVCPFCRSAVSRTDRGLADLGKVAEIVDSQSPLRIGLKGVWNTNKFELTGRCQIKHDSGGFWDEWYATFSNGWVGWLAEAQGKFYLTFYQPLPPNTQVPVFEQLQIGQPLTFGKGQFVVAEKGIATAIAADGEIPYKLVPNERNYYADLAGQNNAFATIDFGTNPAFVFVGKQVTLAEIGLENAKPVVREAQKVKAVGIGCPNCGGPINLQVPDKAERVTCPNCDSLLDVNQGNFTWLKSLTPSPDSHQLDLQIGAEGTFYDKKYKIIGAVVRSVKVEGITYFWHEYLLYNPAIGFRWLVHSENHWSFVESVNVAEVTAMGDTAQFGGKNFKIFQDANAVVEYVKGEFYWRVEAGETVRAVDYVAPPLMLSSEITANEMNWSQGTYLAVADVEKAFGIADLPKPWTTAPNQPYEGSFYYTYGFAFVAILFVVAVFMIPLKGIESVALPTQNITLQPLPSQNGSNPAFSIPFDLRGNSNVKITMTAPVINAFASFDVDLVNEVNNDVESVPIDVEFYTGTEDGESWSEGSTTKDVSLSSVPAGKYTLRIDGQWTNWNQPLPVTVKVEQNTTRGLNFFCAFLLLLIVPIWKLIRKLMFESSRWSESMFGGSSSTGDEGDE
jgi:Zn finger protein HypA/HybF involved in hydrogenase expression